jgi:microcystin-dependent protein
VDIHEVAQTIASAGGSGGVRFRQGTVVSVQSDGTITATIAGSAVSVAGVKCWTSVLPEPGHGVWLATDGVDLIAVGTIGGPVALPGEVKMYAGWPSPAPPGWLVCDGSAVSRTTYDALFAVIGTAYGAGDGSTTFNLPDFRDRFPVGSGYSYAAGATGGEAAHQLTAAEMPSHRHSMAVDLERADSAGSTNSNRGTSAGRYIAAGTATICNFAGSDGSHENRPPYLSVYFLIRT